MTGAQLARREGIDAERGERLGHERAVADIAAPHGNAVARGQDLLEPLASNREGAADDRLPARPEQVAGDVGRSTGTFRAAQTHAEELRIGTPGIVEDEERPVED